VLCKSVKERESRPEREREGEGWTGDREREIHREIERQIKPESA
jgi:hypothetical protein